MNHRIMDLLNFLLIENSRGLKLARLLGQADTGDTILSRAGRTLVVDPHMPEAGVPLLVNDSGDLEIPRIDSVRHSIFTFHGCPAWSVGGSMSQAMAQNMTRAKNGAAKTGASKKIARSATQAKTSIM
jgi:hypothetical protein